MRPIWLILVAAAVGIAPAAAADKPLPLAEAAAKMTVPPGFHVTLFAGEPRVVQPIAFTFDDRGRMWVVECVTYPKWVQPGQPGKDRVIILEDTDGDGVHDKKTVVIDNGVNLSGIELGFGGMYLCSTPNFIFIPIKDDKPAGPSQILLDGWNLKDAKHNVFNALNWGPDGWLYGCNGIQTKSNVGKPGTADKDRTYMDCGVWRYHPTRHVFEVYATGTTNPWGLDWDESGEMFITNCVIDHLWHIVPGGRYERMYGQDSNPFAFGYMKSAVDYRHWGGGHWTESRADKGTGAVKKSHDDAGGGHAHSGCTIYLGDNFPAQYRNTLFTCNIHGGRLNNDGLERTASGMKGVRRPDFQFANDPWFRGICVKQGPEGGIYVSDWCDTGECHNYDVADTTNGRIYRTTYGKPKAFTGDVSKMTDDELVKAHESKNEWLVRKARRVLQERLVTHTNPDAIISGLNAIASGSTAIPARLRAVQTLAAVGKYVVPAADNDTLRAATVELSAECAERDEAIVKFAANEKSPRVRRAVASAMRYAGNPARLAAASTLMTRDADNADANLAQLYWLGVQPAVLADPTGGLALIPKIKIHTVRANIVRMVLSVPNTDPTSQLALVLPVLAAAADDAAREDILAGIRAAFDDRKRVTPPPAWTPLYPKLSASASVVVRDLADDVALKFGDEQAIAMLAFAATHHKDAAGRVRAIERLSPLKNPKLEFGSVLRTLLNNAQVRGAAVRGLAYYPDAETPAAIIKAYATFTAPEKADAVQTLAGRPAFALALLDAVAAGTVPKADVSAFAARQMLALNDKAVAAKLDAVWGTVRPASQTRAAQTSKLKQLLTPEYVKTANMDAGKMIYTRQCAACHKLHGEGGDVGPELTGAQRTNLDYILENVLDPNAVVPFDYKMTTFQLIDGRTVSGLVKKETPQAVSVRTVNELVVIPVADVEKRTPTQNSVMPEGLLDTLTDAETRDLIAYLTAKK